ncbi:MAG: hypothetical protein QXY05_04160 [Candidatus Anstonellales archaeon]
MRNLHILILLFLLLLSLSFSSKTSDTTVSTSLYKCNTVESSYSVNTKLYFKNVFKVSPESGVVVLDPGEGGTQSDLGDNAVICPGKVTLSSKVDGEYAHGSQWSATVDVLSGDDSGYADYNQVSPGRFKFSSNLYQDYYTATWEYGIIPDFNRVNEKVKFCWKINDCTDDTTKGGSGGAVKSKIKFSAGSQTYETPWLESDSSSWTVSLSEGSYELSSVLGINGAVIGIARDNTQNDNYDSTHFFAFTKLYSCNDDGAFSTSLPKASIRIQVLNANDVSMELVSRQPGDPVPLPTDMTIVVKNTGPIPIKVTSASITPGYSIREISGFGEEIPAGNQHTIKVHLEATQTPPPESGTITLKYQSVGPTCDGTVKTKDLNFGISTGVGKPDLSPKITWRLPLPFYEGNEAGITIQDCNQLSRAGAHDSTYSIKTNDGNNIIKEETVRVGELDAGKCQQLYNGNVVCTKNIIVTVCSDVKNEVDEGGNEGNNCITETQACSGAEEAGNCTITPSYATFIPPSSKYFKLTCGAAYCTEAKWKLEDLDEHVSASVDNHGATVYVDAEAPPQKGRLVADAKLNEEKYTCSSVIDIIESECEDYI